MLLAQGDHHILYWIVDEALLGSKRQLHLGLMTRPAYLARMGERRLR